jgi:hypothetical protein
MRPPRKRNSTSASNQWAVPAGPTTVMDSFGYQCVAGARQQHLSPRRCGISSSKTPLESDRRPTHHNSKASAFANKLTRHAKVVALAVLRAKSTTARAHMSSDSLQLGRSLQSCLYARPVLQQYTTVSEHEVHDASTWRNSTLELEEHTFASSGVLFHRSWGADGHLRNFPMISPPTMVRIPVSVREGKRLTRMAVLTMMTGDTAMPPLIALIE